MFSFNKWKLFSSDYEMSHVSCYTTLGRLNSMPKLLSQKCVQLTPNIFSDVYYVDCIMQFSLTALNNFLQLFIHAISSVQKCSLTMHPCNCIHWKILFCHSSMPKCSTAIHPCDLIHAYRVVNPCLSHSHAVHSAARTDILTFSLSPTLAALSTSSILVLARNLS